MVRKKPKMKKKSRSGFVATVPILTDKEYKTTVNIDGDQIICIIKRLPYDQAFDKMKSFDLNSTVTSKYKEIFENLSDYITITDGNISVDDLPELIDMRQARDLIEAIMYANGMIPECSSIIEAYQEVDVTFRKMNVMEGFEAMEVLEKNDIFEYVKTISKNLDNYIVDIDNEELELSPEDFSSFDPDTNPCNPWTILEICMLLGRESGVLELPISLSRVEFKGVCQI